MPWPKQHQFKRAGLSGDSSTRARGARPDNVPPASNAKICRQAMELAIEECRLGGRIVLNESGEHPICGVRRAGESVWAMAICNEYLLMPKRSLLKLQRRCLRKAYHGLLVKAPTLDTLKSWSRRFDWQARALLFDWQDAPEMRRMLDAIERSYRPNV